MWRPMTPPLDGEVIRQARTRQFLSQQEVTDRLAGLGVWIDRSTLSNIENGKTRYPPPKMIPVLARVLGLEVEEMYAAEDAA